MTDFSLKLSNSFVGRRQIEADKRAEIMGNSKVCWRAAQGALSLAAIIQTVILLAAAILILPFSTFVICSPAVRSFDVRLLNSLAASAFAIIAPWKQALESCCCARDRGQVAEMKTRIPGVYRLDGSDQPQNPTLATNPTTDLP